jgi:hypothetical protein
VGTPPAPLRINKAKLVADNGTEVTLHGVNWWEAAAAGFMLIDSS